MPLLVPLADLSYPKNGNYNLFDHSTQSEIDSENENTSELLKLILGNLYILKS